MRAHITQVALVAMLLYVGSHAFEPVRAQRREAPTAAAMVASLQGDVRVRTRTGGRPVRLFDRLREGDTIQTGAEADIMLVFGTGIRMRLGGSGEARVRAGGLETRKGRLETLPPIPTVPLVAPVAGAGTTVTAVRIRAGNLQANEPAPGETLLADAVVLACDPDGAEVLRFEIAAPDATVVFREHTTAPHVRVPPSVLAPGVTYRWEVTARRPTGFETRTGGTFATLPAAVAAQRSALLAALSDSDAESTALLAELDFTLGLWRPALVRFRAALAAGLTDAVVGERVAALERLLGPSTEGLVP